MLNPCNGNTDTLKYNYFNIGYTKEIDKVDYVSNGGIDTMAVDFKNNRGYLYIYGLPLKKEEFKETCKIDIGNEKVESFEIEVEIDNKIIRGEQKNYDDGKCSVQCVDYRDNAVFFITYGGDRNDISVFKDLVKSITYEINSEFVERMRKKYLDTKLYIKNLDVPAYEKAKNKRVTFCITSLTKRMEYEVQPDENPLGVLDLYKRYFNSIHWVPYMAADDNPVDLKSGQIHYLWKSPENDVIAVYWCLSHPTADAESRSMYMVYIHVLPVIAGY
jgi:hypothetical protein